MTVFKPLIIEDIVKNCVTKRRVLILVKSDGTALRSKRIQYAAIKNAFHLAGTVEGAALKIAVMKRTVSEDRLIKRHTNKLAICNPYRVDISAGEGAVAKSAAGETSAFQISVIENNFIKNAFYKNGTVEQRIIEFSVFPALMLDNLETEIAVWCQTRARLVCIYFIHSSLPHSDSMGVTRR